MERGGEEPDDEHERRPGGPGRPGEVSPYNPNAIRGPNGIWNEESLPVMEWEAADNRVVLPLHLQRALGLEVAVLRWARVKHMLVRCAHSQTVELRQLANLTHYLDLWQYAGSSEAAPNTFRVFFEESGRWSLAVIAIDKNGSTNFVTLFSPSRLTRLPNMIRKGSYMRRE